MWNLPSLIDRPAGRVVSYTLGVFQVVRSKYIQEVQSLGRTETREAKLFELSPPALSYVVWWPAFLPECLRGRAACSIVGIAQSVQHE